MMQTKNRLYLWWTHLLNKFKSRLPSDEYIKNHKSLRFLKQHLEEPRLWHFTKGATSRAAWIGIFMCFMPMPFQMIPAAILALLLRANLILSVALVWISNPITMLPMMYGCYRLGNWLLGKGAVFPLHEKFSLTLILTHLSGIFIPLILGCVLCGLFFGAIAYTCVNFLWKEKV